MRLKYKPKHGKPAGSLAERQFTRLLNRMARRDGRARPATTDLRADRPEPIDKRGLPCELCEEEYPAKDLAHDDGAWLCGRCAGFLQHHRRVAEQVSQAR